ILARAADQIAETGDQRFPGQRRLRSRVAPRRLYDGCAAASPPDRADCAILLRADTDCCCGWHEMRPRKAPGIPCRDCECGFRSGRAERCNRCCLSYSEVVPAAEVFAEPSLPRDRW